MTADIAQLSGGALMVRRVLVGHDPIECSRSAPREVAKSHSVGRPNRSTKTPPSTIM
jgi:hypothetical protein